jgi:hypothetical protein
MFKGNVCVGCGKPNQSFHSKAMGKLVQFRIFDFFCIVFGNVFTHEATRSAHKCNKV